MDNNKFSVYMPGLETEGSKLAAQRAMHSQYVLQLLQLQRRAGFLCDITVNIQEKSFKAHKPLLAACSLYFRALFADSENAKTSTLNFEKLSPSGFEVLLDYIYSGSLAITSDNSDQVLYAANCLQMTNVVETCLNFIRSSFQVTSGNTGGQAPGMGGKELQPNNQNNPPVIHISTEQKDGIKVVTGTSIPAIPPKNPQYPDPRSKQIAAAQTYPPPTYEKSDQLKIPPAMQPLLHGPQATQHNPPVPPQILNITNPTSEALTVLMPYLVAKNARRPTINEVKQLLLSGNHPGNTQPEESERYTLKQPPPALIPASEAQEKNVSLTSSTTSLNTPTPDQNLRPLVIPASMQPSNVRPQENMIMQTPNLSTEDVNITNLTTAHPGHTYDVNNHHVTSREMQPFVLISSDINPSTTQATIRQQTSDLHDESSKGSAWSDDRSVGIMHNDENATHLSGTPCSTILTMNDSRSTSGPADFTIPRFSTVSPASYSSSPRIEISPISTASDSQASGDMSATKTRWARAQSLDFSKMPPTQHDPIINSPNNKKMDSHELRSTSLSPRLYREENYHSTASAEDEENRSKIPGDHSALISIEQATNAVGALFVGTGSEKSKESSSSVTSPGDESVEQDEGDLIIEETSRDEPHEEHSVVGNDSTINQNDLTANLTKQEEKEVQGFPTDCGEKDCESESGIGTDAQRDRFEAPIIKREFESTTSPPLDDPFSLTEHDVAESTSSATASVANSSRAESDVDENCALDLSMPKNAKSMTVQRAPPVRIVPEKLAVNAPNKANDSKMREALDALVMMQNSVAPVNVMPPQSVLVPPSQQPEENSKLAGFSRKPRRSSGGQTCQWPGCGRLFRHRNIYEEHRKLHEMGVPVTQLRKCYMGARVKKTARERLEEMRSVDGSASQNSAADDAVEARQNGERIVNSTPQRPSLVRKRNSSSYTKEGHDRKRVTVKDRKDHFFAQNMHWQQQQLHQQNQQQAQVPTSAQIRHPAPPLLSQAPSIPLAVLQAVSSNGAMRWQSPRPPTVNGIGGLPPNILNQVPAQDISGYLQQQSTQAAALAGMRQHEMQSQVSISANNSAVVETLAALGIPLPAKRGGDEIAPRSNAPGPLLSPTTAMTLDQLRRTIALRDGAAHPLEERGDIGHRAPSRGGGGAEAQLPMHQVLSSLMLPPAQRPGNVTGKNSNMDPNSIAIVPLDHAPVSIQMSVPTNPYHGATAASGPHGPQCS